MRLEKVYNLRSEHASYTSRDRFLYFQDTLYNTSVKKTATDITKKALGLLPHRLADTGARIIGTAHDEIILEVPEEKAYAAAAILRETMIEAGKAYLSKVPVEVEVTIGETWAEK